MMCPKIRTIFWDVLVRSIPLTYRPGGLMPNCRKPTETGMFYDMLLAPVILSQIAFQS
jgi:hypothetical protein